MAALAQRLLRSVRGGGGGGAADDGSVSHDMAAGLRDARASVVHVRRPEYRRPPRGATAAQLLAQLPPGAGVVVDVARPHKASGKLADFVAQPAVRDLIVSDVEQLAGQLGELLQLEKVHAKLELVALQPCPRWHADAVGARALVTYCGGAGATWYVPNSAVTRRRRGPAALAGALAGAAGRGGGGGGGEQQPPPLPAIARVDEARAVQAGVGDVLLLKGESLLPGRGAVHRSPAMPVSGGGGLGLEEEEGEEEEEEYEGEGDGGEGGGGRGGGGGGGVDERMWRLLLTVDDVLPCGCGQPHR